MLQGFSRICLHSHYMWGYLPAGYQEKMPCVLPNCGMYAALIKRSFFFPNKGLASFSPKSYHCVANHGPFAFQNLPLYPVFFDIIICRQYNCRTCWNFKDWCFQRNVLLDCKHSDGAIKPTVHTNTQCERIISMVYTATNAVLSLPLQSIWAPMWLSCGEVGKFFRNV